MMNDNYPTRTFPEDQIMRRLESVVCGNETIGGYQGARFALDGALKISGFFRQEEIACASVDAERLKLSAKDGVMRESGSEAIRTILEVHDRDPFRALSYDGKLISAVRELLGADIYVHQSRINYKYPMVGSGWSWHSDFETWHAQDGMPGMRCLTAMIPLSKNDASNGALLTIPGSHAKFISCAKSQAPSDYAANWADQKDGLPSNAAIMQCLSENGGRVESMDCDIGDLILFDCNVLHGSVANMSPRGRANLFFVFNAIGNELQAPFCGGNPRPEYAATRAKMKEARR